MRKLLLLGFVFILLVINVNSTLLDNLVSYWDFDDDNLYDSDTNITDLVSGNDGELTNGVAPKQDGKLGNSFLYDGTNDYVDYGIFPEFSFADTGVNYTINCWIRPHTEASADSGAVFGIRDTGGGDVELQLWYNHDTRVMTSWNGAGNVASTSTYPNDAWTMWTWRRNSSTNYEYLLNGTTAGKGTQNRGTTNADQTLKSGWSGASSGNEWFEGYIDECGIWERWLTDSELLELYGENGEGLEFTEFGGGEPSLTLAVSFVNGTYYEDVTPISFTYNGTFDDANTDIVNITITLNQVLNATLNDINLSVNNPFNITFNQDFEGMYNISINATNYELSIVYGYWLNISYESPLNTTTEILLGYIHNDLQLIYEVLEMIPLVLMYLGLMWFAYYLMKTSNFLVGLIFWVQSLGFDFLLIAEFWNKYLPLVAGTIYGRLIWVFLAMMVSWLIGKIYAIFVIRGSKVFPKW